jgi:hypothetical protein
MSSPTILPATIISKKPDIQFLTIDVPPPSNLYLNADDKLIIRATCRAVVTFTIQARILGPNGEINTNQWTVTTAAGATLLQSFPLKEGFLLSLVAQGPSSITPHGNCWVELGITRLLEQSGTIFWQLIAAGYVSTFGKVCWPGGTIAQPGDGQGNFRIITGTDPAAGAEINESVPNNARWLLHAIQFSLVTDATVATRGVQILIDDGITELLRLLQSTNQTASNNVFYQAWQMGQIVSSAGFNIQFAAPFPLPLPPQARFRTVTSALQAGDNFGAPRYLVEEWIST